jgi:hypothetical protein
VQLQRLLQQLSSAKRLLQLGVMAAAQAAAEDLQAKAAAASSNVKMTLAATTQQCWPWQQHQRVRPWQPGYSRRRLQLEPRGQWAVARVGRGSESRWPPRATLCARSCWVEACTPRLVRQEATGGLCGACVHLNSQNAATCYRSRCCHDTVNSSIPFAHITRTPGCLCGHPCQWMPGHPQSRCMW